MIADDPAARRACAFLTIDLAAIAANYRRLQSEANGARTAAVVKADAYGLGTAKVGPALARAGAEAFFVAQLDEAIALRAALAETCPEAKIHVLMGPMAGTEADFLAHGIVPVLNSLDDLTLWQRLARKRGDALPAVLHIDTGMNRLGLSPAELDVLADDHGRLAGVTLTTIMSHLACAEEPNNPMNAAQREAFATALKRLPRAAASLANSSGIFLGAAYHFDLLRPGVALYGVNPCPGKPNPMAQVVNLKGKILQVREIDAPQSVGYGASHRVEGATRLATVGVGYADGYLRSLSNRGSAFVGGQRVAVMGRVSMDLITLDITSVPREQARPGALVDLLDPVHGVDALAEEAGTIGYEVLTALGRRYHRHYVTG